MKVKYRKISADDFWLIVFYFDKSIDFQVERTDYGTKMRIFSIDGICIAYLKYNCVTCKATHYAHPTELQ